MYVLQSVCYSTRIVVHLLLENQASTSQTEDLSVEMNTTGTTQTQSEVPPKAASAGDIFMVIVMIMIMAQDLDIS